MVTYSPDMTLGPAVRPLPPAQASAGSPPKSKPSQDPPASTAGRATNENSLAEANGSSGHKVGHSCGLARPVTAAPGGTGTATDTGQPVTSDSMPTADAGSSSSPEQLMIAAVQGIVRQAVERIVRTREVCVSLTLAWVWPQGPATVSVRAPVRIEQKREGCMSVPVACVCGT